MKFKILAAVAAALMVVPVCQADIFDVRVTECWIGLSGPDGTADWFEITNFGDTVVDTGDIFYDDSNPMLSEGGFLESIALGPGESAVFLTSIEASDDISYDNAFLEFLDIWNYSGLIGIPAGGGNLGAGGDSVNLFQVDGSKLVPIDTLEYDDTFANVAATIERIGEGISDIRHSVLGENGTFESDSFFNDNLGDIRIVGSPGLFEGKLSEELLGDVNCDGVVSLLDVDPFVELLTTGGFSAKADINGDGVVSLLDVDPFVALLVG